MRGVFLGRCKEEFRCQANTFLRSFSPVQPASKQHCEHVIRLSRHRAAQKRRNSVAHRAQLGRRFAAHHSGISSLLG